MRRIILYTAMSIDGFIAREDGAIDWLDRITPEPSGYGYDEFYASVDITVIGRATYEQIIGFGGPFPYPDSVNYVLSRTPRESAEYVTFITGDAAAFVRSLREGDGGDIWLVGGGKTNAYFLGHSLIDRLVLSVLPVALGEGIGLFGGVRAEAAFNAVSVERYSNGVIQTVYDRTV